MQFLGNSYNLNVGSAMSLVLMIIVPVSYTHLDVYKRQAFRYGLTASLLTCHGFIERLLRKP